MTNVMKESYDLMLAIVRRAQKLGIARGSQLTQMMDLENANRQFKLRLNDMLAADDFDFAHDFTGIQDNIDRSDGLISRFVPRFSQLK